MKAARHIGQSHTLKWLKNLELEGLDKETLSEYMITYEYLTDKIQRMDERIQSLAEGERYCEQVQNMSCLLGIKNTYCAFIACRDRRL